MQELKQGRELEAGAAAETLKWCCLLTCFLADLACSLSEPGKTNKVMFWALPLP